MNTSGNINNNNVNNDNNGVSPDWAEEPETVSKQSRSENRKDSSDLRSGKGTLFPFIRKRMEKHMLSGERTHMLS